MVLDDNERSKKLKKVATEILSTETTYVERLTLINNDFHDYFIKRSKALQEKNYPTVKQIDAMFLNLGSILSFHTILLAELEDALKNWDKKQKIGEIFKKMAPFIKLYATYISGYQITQDTLQAYLRKYQKFATDIEHQQKLPQCQSLTLMHHMLEPIQRVPRYRMLLQEYKKYLPTDHPDFNDLSSSLEMVMQSADHANNSIHEYESALKLMEIQNRIISNIVIIVPGRKIIHEGELNRCIGNNVSKHKSCYIFLFNDIFLDCNHSNNKKIKQHAFYQNSDIAVSNKVNNGGHYFSIRNDDTSITYSCKTKEERDMWVEKIQSCIDVLLEKKKTFKSSDSASENDDYMDDRALKVGEYFGLKMKNQIKKELSIDQNYKTDAKQSLIFPLCDGILDVKFDKKSSYTTYFSVLSMHRKLLLYNMSDTTDILHEYDIEGYSLYKNDDDSKNGSDLCFCLTNDNDITLNIKAKDKKVLDKWVSMLRRSGVIVCTY